MDNYAFKIKIEFENSKLFIYSGEVYDKMNNTLDYVINDEMILVFENEKEAGIKMCLKEEFRSVDETPVIHEFLNIDLYIEDSSLLEPYQTNAEVDGVVADYMELVV